MLVEPALGHRWDARLGEDPAADPADLDKKRGAELDRLLCGLEGLTGVCGFSSKELQCCARNCVLGLLTTSNARLRSLYTHARAYNELLTDMQRDGSRLPTTGVAYHAREKKRSATGGAADGETVALLPETPDDDGSSYAEDVRTYLSATCYSPGALNAARDSFVLDGVRELLGRGCCVRSLCAVLDVSNQYLYHTPKGDVVPRIRRAGVVRGASEDPAAFALSMVSVEDLSLLGIETNSPCTCCSHVSPSVRCASRPFGPLALLEMRLRYVTSSSTREQRAQLLSHLWQSLTGRPSTVSLAWLADLLGVPARRLVIVQQACAAAAHMTQGTQHTCYLLTTRIHGTGPTSN